jgi:RNA recognition motif-containing protein
MAQYGEIDSCVVMRDPTGRSRGFAFLTYRSPASVSRVLERAHHLDGKQVSLPLALFLRSTNAARSTQNEPFHVQNMNVPLKFSWAVSHLPLPVKASKSFCRNSDKLWMLRSCLTKKPLARKALHLRRFRMKKRSTGQWRLVGLSSRASLYAVLLLHTLPELEVGVPADV